MPKKILPFIEVDGVRVHPDLATLLVDVDQLSTDDENSQLHGTDSILDIAKSLTAFGWQIPAIYNPDSMKMVVGSGRLLAAKHLGWRKIAAIPFRGDAAAALAFGIADNQTSTRSVWDVDQLRDSLGRLGETDFAGIFTDDSFGSVFGDDADDDAPARAAVWVEIGSLVPWSKNPRVNAAAALEVAKSIIVHGWGAPIVAQSATRRVIAGHARLLAAKHLVDHEWNHTLSEWDARDSAEWKVEGAPAPGLVPVRFVDVDDRTADRLAIADNKMVEVAAWDELGLGDLLRSFSEEDLGLFGLGFDEDESSELMTGSQAEVEEDEVPELDGVAVSAIGDLWLLGKHRVLCGDSTSADHMALLVGDGVVDALITDPPYGVSYVDKLIGIREADGGKKPIHAPISNDHMTLDETIALWEQSLKNCFESTKEGGTYYIASPQGGDLGSSLMESIIRSGWLLKHTLIWVKNCMVLGRCDYSYKHEPILYGWKPGAGHYFGGKTTDTSVWEFDKPSRSKHHPTMKPVALIAHAAERALRRGEIMLDPFLGSGTAVIAAEQTGRICYGLELSPTYVDVIVKRWEALTGLVARLEDGRTFPEVAAARGVELAA